MKNKAAQQLGRLGGKVKSEAKAKAAQENGKKGGRPNMKNEIEKIIKKLEDRQEEDWIDPSTKYGSGYIDGLETAISLLKTEFKIEDYA